MSLVDWLVLAITVLGIVGYGVVRERRIDNSEAYLRGGHDARWWTMGLSIMATQASAITFLSMPGQAYEDGMGFVQFYFGQPIAMVLLAAFIVPVYYKLNVFTAYEYLERRFDRKTRQLTALLFLISRGLAAGISIYAPAIVLSTVLGWPLALTNLIIGGAVILYTVSGGTRVVNRTQPIQMVVMLLGMAAAALFVWSRLPSELSFGRALHLAGALGRLNAVDFSPRLDTRYTIWSGLTGGLFVGLAYFGTDQSQVQRYLGGESLRQSRLGLVFTGLVKVPMQCLILFVGVLVFLFHRYEPAPVFFDRPGWAHASAHDPEGARRVETEWGDASAAARASTSAYVASLRDGDEASVTAARRELERTSARQAEVRTRAKQLAAQAGVDPKDGDYLFIDFVLAHFPPGLVGLLIAVILCASMSAVAAALTSLGSTSVVDFYRVSWKPGADDRHYVWAGRAFVVAWGLIAVGFAVFAARLDNLIQAVNILGSIFYGPMLGVFVVGFFVRGVRATPVFVGVLVGQAAVLGLFFASSIGFLWYNVIGCAVVVAVALVLEGVGRLRQAEGRLAS